MHVIGNFHYCGLVTLKNLNFMSIFDRIKWLAIRRPNLKKIDSWAHWTAYVDSLTQLSVNHKFEKGVLIHDSVIGRHTYFAKSKVVRADIGAFTCIGPEAFIGGLGRHPTNFISTHPIFYSSRRQTGKTFAKKNLIEEIARISIGNDVWIGARAVILDGISVGDGAIIAAGAVVVKDVPPYAVVGGVPAKVIRYRFTEDVIEQLLDWKWWQLPDSVLANLAEDFCGSTEWTCEMINAIRNKLVLSTQYIK